MIEDRIGSIGSTQGVKLSSRPSTKKIGSTVSNEPDFSAPSMRPGSLAVTGSDATDLTSASDEPPTRDVALSTKRAVRVSGG